MNDCPPEQAERIAALADKLGLPPEGVRSAWGFLQAAYFHIGFPQLSAADRWVALDASIRRATQRIACQGSAGDQVLRSKILSVAARHELEQALASSPWREGLRNWKRSVTFEHQDRVAAIIADIGEREPQLTVFDVLERLLGRPGIVGTRNEDRRLSGAGMRKSGSADQRYEAAQIAPSPVLRSASDIVWETYGASVGGSRKYA